MKMDSLEQLASLARPICHLGPLPCSFMKLAFNSMHACFYLAASMLGPAAFYPLQSAACRVGQWCPRQPPEPVPNACLRGGGGGMAARAVRPPHGGVLHSGGCCGGPVHNVCHAARQREESDIPAANLAVAIGVHLIVRAELPITLPSSFFSQRNVLNCPRCTTVATQCLVPDPHGLNVCELVIDSSRPRVSVRG